jgi:hypothetical protein
VQLGESDENWYDSDGTVSYGAAFDKPVDILEAEEGVYVVP